MITRVLGQILQQFICLLLFFVVVAVHPIRTLLIDYSVLQVCVCFFFIKKILAVIKSNKRKETDINISCILLECKRQTQTSKATEEKKTQNNKTNWARAESE